MENKNGQGIFYGVIGVATLVVAIIGATFAYFSASASTNAGDIAGQTLGGSGGVLGLQVQKVDFGTTGATSNDLVPTDISTQALIETAINAKCVAPATAGDTTGTKYTGCHLYTIHATSQSAVNGATLALTSLTATVPTGGDAAKWHYALFEATESSGTYTISSMLNSTPAVFPSAAVNILNNQNLSANYDHTFYMLIYVENAATSQNSGGSTDVTGSYQGTITFTTSEGSQVQATFSA